MVFRAGRTQADGLAGFEVIDAQAGRFDLLAALGEQRRDVLGEQRSIERYLPRGRRDPPA